MLMFVISPSPRCCCSAPQQAWHRLTRGHLCSCSADTSLCSFASLCLSSVLLSLSLFICSPVVPFLPLLPLPLVLPLYFVHVTSYFLARIFSPFPSRRLSSPLRPSTSLSHTLVATLKTGCHGDSCMLRKRQRAESTQDHFLV